MQKWRWLSMPLVKLLDAFIQSDLHTQYCGQSPQEQFGVKCLALLSCLNKTSINRLQQVQIAAARLLTRSIKTCHITPILSALHWLPVHLRTQFQVLVFTYRAVHGQAPAYVNDLIHPHSTTRALRSSEQGLLRVPRTRLKTKGDRAFGITSLRN